MDSFEPKKLALIRILQILEHYTDCDHPLKHDEIVKKLENDYGITVEKQLGVIFPFYKKQDTILKQQRKVLILIVDYLKILNSVCSRIAFLQVNILRRNIPKN